MIRRLPGFELVGDPLPKTTVPFAAFGVLSVWIAFTGQFEGAVFNLATITGAILPTVAAIYLIWLAGKSYSTGDDA